MTPIIFSLMAFQSLCVWVYVQVYVCVWERERERMWVRKRERESVREKRTQCLLIALNSGITPGMPRGPYEILNIQPWLAIARQVS